MSKIENQENYLSHYGILGQKWGVRRFQNEDGTLTEEGRRRYASKMSDRQYEEYKKQRKDVQKDILRNLDRNQSFRDAVSNAQQKNSALGKTARVARALILAHSARTLASLVITPKRVANFNSFIERARSMRMRRQVQKELMKDVIRGMPFKVV